MASRDARDETVDALVVDGECGRRTRLDHGSRIFYNVNFPSRSAENRGPDGLFSAASWTPLDSGPGGGCVIACACDLRVCTPAAKFGVPIARTLGNCLSAANYSRLIELIGPARTKDLMFTGRLMDSTEAASAGLVTRLVGADAIDAAVRELADTIASNAPMTLRTAKETIRCLALRHRLGPTESDDLIASCYASGDFREGVAAFLEKRKPRFIGK